MSLKHFDVTLTLSGKRTRLPRVTLTALFATLTLGCTSIPTSGPSRNTIVERTQSQPLQGIQLVPVSEPIARRLLKQNQYSLFSNVLRDDKQDTITISPGDTLEVTVWEAPPASLFGTADLRAATTISTSRPSTLPEQTVNSDGTISIPFAGTVRASGRTPRQIENEIVAKLSGKANQPQVLVRPTKSNSNIVTVIGDVTASIRLPLTPRSERLLEAIAAAGGTRNPTNKTTIQVTRGDRVVALPLETIIKDPNQNILLRSGDIVTAIYQPLSFTVLGATGRNDEINFEAQGISLAQALGRMGGLQDARADVRGVFIFRYEDYSALEWQQTPVVSNAQGKVPVIYTIDLSDPVSFFVVQGFAIRNRDLVYVSNAPLSEIQKFSNVVSSIVFPIANTILLTR